MYDMIFPLKYLELSKTSSVVSPSEMDSVSVTRMVSSLVTIGTLENSRKGALSGAGLKIFGAEPFISSQ